MELSSEIIKIVDFKPLTVEDNPLYFSLEIHKYIRSKLYFGKVLGRVQLRIILEIGCMTLILKKI